MYTLPAARAWRPTVGAPLERGVRPQPRAQPKRRSAGTAEAVAHALPQVRCSVTETFRGAAPVGLAERKDLRIARRRPAKRTKTATLPPMLLRPMAKDSVQPRRSRQVGGAYEALHRVLGIHTHGVAGVLDE